MVARRASRRASDARGGLCRRHPSGARGAQRAFGGVIVLDASSVVELVLGTPVLGHRAAREIVSAGGVLHGPHLVDAEVGQTLRRFVLRGIISSGRASMALSRL